MKYLNQVFFVIFLFFSYPVIANENWKEKTEKAEYIHRAIKQLTDVMVYDIYSPPVASRTYAYISIAGYEAVVAGNTNYQTLAGQLHGLKILPKPRQGQEYSSVIAAVHAILAVGKTMVISENKIQVFYESIMNGFEATGIPVEIFNNSIAFGQQIAKHIIEWAAQDDYKQTRTFAKYALTTDAAHWKPTPPAYMKAVEPHWNKIRSFVFDSAQQFKPLPPTPFSADKNSQFYKEALAVRDIGLNLSAEQKEIASFWDCNPFKMNVNGHVMYASKKISPGGHWMNITRLACQKKSANAIESLEAYACLAITIADAFISCWDEKYRSLVIRPESYINQYIDGAWMPLLQTPPFPEYTSGHSVLSTAASVMLTKIFGDNFSFADSTEVEFGIPVRHFTSFIQAAEEAAISRFYGGIHYMPSIVNGSDEGKKIGAFMIKKLKTSK
ncbi:MAG TPA: vanadium-dependent haloperoxidase [Chitinophagaceae bacterium]|nr:vanadium-dependent haloperoxidase [Chitinophagaceae bacterium]